MVNLCGKPLRLRILETEATFPPLLGDAALVPLLGRYPKHSIECINGQDTRLFLRQDGQEVLRGHISNGITLLPLDPHQGPPQGALAAVMDDTVLAGLDDFSLLKSGRALAFPSGVPSAADLLDSLPTTHDDDLADCSSVASDDSLDDTELLQIESSPPVLDVYIKDSTPPPQPITLPFNDLANYIHFLHCEYNHASTRKLLKVLHDVRIPNKAHLVQSVVTACHCRMTRHTGAGPLLGQTHPPTARLQSVSVDLIDMAARPSSRGFR